MVNVGEILLNLWNNSGFSAIVSGFTAQGGGGSDANVYNAKGIQSVVLGTGMTKVHTTQEFITVANLENCAALALDLLTH